MSLKKTFDVGGNTQVKCSGMMHAARQVTVFLKSLYRRNIYFRSRNYFYYNYIKNDCFISLNIPIFQDLYRHLSGLLSRLKATLCRHDEKIPISRPRTALFKFNCLSLYCTAWLVKLFILHFLKTN